MKTITKWVVSYTKHNEVSTTVKEVNPYIPLNRLLKTVGWYTLERIRLGGVNYMITFSPSDSKGQRSHILVTKICDKSGVSLTNSNKYHIEIIAELFLNQYHINVN